MEGIAHPMLLTIRRAEIQDAATLSDFGRRVFHETFGPQNRAEHLAAYLDSAYTEARQRGEIEDPAVHTLLVEEDDRLVAFAQLREAPPPPSVPAGSPVELWRFYVDPHLHGRGVAATLMTAVEQRARALDARTLWLGVWEKNTRAQAFYRKHGFAVAGSQIFMLGGDAQRDLVMANTL